jgi:prolyl-tRNA synthetase
MEDELEAIGAVGGYASPIGLDPSQMRVVADPSVRSGRNFVSGANRPDFHIKNVNVPRDFSPGEWRNLALIEEGDACPRCGGHLQIEPAFALASAAAAAPCQPNAEYLDKDGRAQTLWMADWQLDLARLLSAVVERHHDEHGIQWPASCAPFSVHLVALDVRKEAVAAQAVALYDRLRASGHSVLFDDRSASAGVKFNDADLIGIPLRLTVSKRSVKDGLIEAKWRDSSDRLKLDEEALSAELRRLESE